MEKKILMALLAALLLAVTALAAEEIPAPEPAEPEDVVWMEASGEEEVFQAGALGGPQTLPEEKHAGAVYTAGTFEETVYNGLLAQSAQINVSSYNISEENIKARYFLVVNDHPELFYVGNKIQYSYYTPDCVTAITPTYNAELATPAARNAFQSAAAEALALVNDQMSALEKALVLHDWLITQCEYNWYVGAFLGKPGFNENQVDPRVYSAYGALVRGDAVCQGYALAYKYLLNQAGINSVMVSSDAMGHAWNLVELEGKWYHVDTTWDDPTPDFPGHGRYTYFLLSDETIKARNHHDWEELHSCTDSAYETGYVFHETSWTLYPRGGTYYYIKNSSTGRHSLYSGGVKGEGERQIASLSSPKSLGYQNYFGIVWLEDCLYYMGDDNLLHCLSLQGYGQRTAGPAISFTSAGSDDGAYQAGDDGVGLRYRDGKLQAVSKTRPRLILGEYAPMRFDYPSGWGDRPETQILGLTADRRTAGIVYHKDNNGGDYHDCTLWVACYRPGGQLASVRSVEAHLAEGLNLVALPEAAVAPDGGSVRLMLTLLSMPLLCPAWTA